jgi:hypothetical protein
VQICMHGRIYERPARSTLCEGLKFGANEGLPKERLIDSPPRRLILHPGESWAGSILLKDMDSAPAFAGVTICRRIDDCGINQRFPKLKFVTSAGLRTMALT